MYTDNQIAKALKAFKKEQRLNSKQLQNQLGMPDYTFYRRMNNGGWTFLEVTKMKKLGILKEEETSQE